MINIECAIRDNIIQGFQEAIIWQDGNLDEYSIYDLSAQVNNDIRDLIDSFIKILNDDEITELIKDSSQFGHWLCLEQMGHGSGFYDGVNDVVSGISNKLSIVELYRPGDVYIDDGTLHCDFFKYGK